MLRGRRLSTKILRARRRMHIKRLRNGTLPPRHGGVVWVPSIPLAIINARTRREAYPF